MFLGILEVCAGPRGADSGQTDLRRSSGQEGSARALRCGGHSVSRQLPERPLGGCAQGVRAGVGHLFASFSFSKCVRPLCPVVFRWFTKAYSQGKSTLINMGRFPPGVREKNKMQGPGYTVRLFCETR